MIVEGRHRGLQVVATDVVEIDVDAVGRSRRELFADVTILVVERGVEAEVLDEQAHLFW